MRSTSQTTWSNDPPLEKAETYIHPYSSMIVVLVYAVFQDINNMSI